MVVKTFQISGNFYFWVFKKVSKVTGAKRSLSEVTGAKWALSEVTVAKWAPRSGR